MRHVKKKKPTRPKTGAPPAHFLPVLAIKSNTHYIIANTRAERAALAATPTQEISKSVYFQLVELASRVVQPRHGENAAEDLAMVGIVAANLLEDLARTHEGQEIALAAARQNCWPVNLQVGIKQRNGKPCRTLEGAGKAKEYLVRIKLGERRERVLKHIQNPLANPFTRAAEFLLNSLCEQQQKIAQRGRSRDNNSWSKRLLSLAYPMTAENTEEWWSVAKQWMDEVWESNRDLFLPLIKHLKLDNAKHTPSTVKRQVIDDHLKKAFKALAARR